VLGGKKLLIRKKEIADKGTFYGAQVGPFASREDAVRLCEDLKSAGGTCIVQRN
jgi:cell division septation protein DedD